MGRNRLNRYGLAHWLSGREEENKTVGTGGPTGEGGRTHATLPRKEKEKSKLKRNLDETLLQRKG